MVFSWCIAGFQNLGQSVNKYQFEINFYGPLVIAFGLLFYRRESLLCQLFGGIAALWSVYYFIHHAANNGCCCNGHRKRETIPEKPTTPIDNDNGVHLANDEPVSATASTTETDDKDA